MVISNWTNIDLDGPSGRNSFVFCCLLSPLSFGEKLKNFFSRFYCCRIFTRNRGKVANHLFEKEKL